MSIQIDSYRENWQKDGKDIIFYRRRYIKTFIIILIALYVIFFLVAPFIKISIQFGYIIILMIIYLLLRWTEKYIILGDTFITINDNRFRLIDLLLFTLFFIVYIFINSSNKNKMSCILFKNIIDIDNINRNEIIIHHFVNNEAQLYSVDLDMMLDDEKQLFLQKVELIKQSLKSNL
ncbi:hypothetical protein GYM75_05335 [Gilliamella sp. ESL0441]|uniref:hypothetical protein n=1 Tax=Gilliamella sp. ESL0441 TaxID=2704654 RepID=UPI001C69EEE5|nr:hypothetical protein [Gilliamella sp. ESL0441]QYN44310.1 hypothetical protein GYM75_05335 [Gilliamella sp. ESL0441]